MTDGYRLSNEALTDLSEIYAYTRQKFGTVQADQYANGLEQSLLAIAAFPNIGPEITVFRVPVRVHPHGQHVIIYVVGNGYTLIVRVLAARQHWQQILSQGSE